MSCTNCTDPIFTPDSQTPPTIVYQVCGTILGAGTCNGNPITDCNDVIVTTLPPIAINFNIDPGNICANNIPSINAAITPINLNYNYQWFDAPDGTGNLLSTNSSWTPSGEGSYSLVVTEITSGVLCNTSIHNFDINFDVLGPSTLNVPAPLVVECNDPNASQQIINWLASATAFDDTESLPVTNDYGGITMACNQPPLSVVFSASDECGNVSSASATITVVDTQVPTWTTAVGSLDRTLECSDIVLLNSAQALQPVATDLCDPTLNITKTTGSFVQGTCLNAGTYTNTWTATDDCGNVSAVYTQVITVTDTQSPVVAGSLATTTIEGCIATNAPAAATTVAQLESMPGGITITDACTDDALLTVTHSDVGNGTCPVVVTRTYTITDVCNHSVQITHTINIGDTTPPTFTFCPPGITVNSDGDECFATNVIIGTATATDNCSTPAITNNAPVQYPAGTTTVTWTATDACGNTSTCTQTVTVTDSQPPTITCPANVSAIATAPDCFVPAIVVGNPVYSDNCDVALLTLTWTKTGATTASGSGLVNNTTFNVGVTTVTYTVTDASGNSASCSFTVTVNDQVPPTVITCPPSITQSADAGECDTDVTVAAPVVSDPCNEIVSVTNNSPYKTSDADASGTYPVGTTSITWTFTDTSGNTSTCIQTVTVTDSQPPTITCPANVSAIATAPDCFVPAIVVGNPVYSDNCDVALLTLTWTKTGATTASGSGLVNSTVFNVGVTTVNYTVTDASGNATSCSFTVTVNDQVPPTVITCPPSITQSA
ncbi:MAG TPA: hypothetical protein DHV48_17205, partial [Prolixibacteraceae bacterium]|nr:hypothetical protein [Prolixibacteraceae bacterium]